MSDSYHLSLVEFHPNTVVFRRSVEAAHMLDLMDSCYSLDYYLAVGWYYGYYYYHHYFQEMSSVDLAGLSAVVVWADLC